MRAAELMSTIPGMTMDHLHNWERQGYVAPNRISVGKKQIRDYNENEAHFLKAMWSYYQKGFSPKNAYRNAAEAQAKTSCATFNDYREDSEAQARAIDSLEGIAIFELVTPLRDYFRLNMSGKKSRLITQSSMQ
jgi:DNA-binding transcriptional MerR regulator